MANKSSGRYYAKNTESGTFADITTLFYGVAVLKVDGLNAKGKPVNIFTQQWLSNQKEDFLITTLDDNDNPVVIRENVDLELTFIVRQKYASTTINVQTVHDSFVAYMTNSDVWIKSAYMGNKYAHCVCLKEYKPTAQKLGRGSDSYMMGTITLHCLDAPTT
jgi:hypothetical protein